jgi:hypothetical protein
MRFAEKVVVFHTDDPIITSVTMSPTTVASKVAVVLSGPISPRDTEMRAQRLRVYLDANVARNSNSMIEVAIHACSLSGDWIERQEAQAWYWELVTLCLPMRGRCNSLLKAISAVARQHWGNRYWEAPEARDLLRRELGLMGICAPPELRSSLSHRPDSLHIG